MMRFLKTSSNLILTLRSPFAYQKTQTALQKAFLKNDNLIYQDFQYKMIAYFFLPQIRKANLSFAQINRDSNVLSFVVTTNKNKKVVANPGEAKKPVQEDKLISFSMKYQDLAGLLEVTPDSNSNAAIQNVRKGAQNNFVKTLNIADNPSKRCVQFNFEQKLQHNDPSPRKTTFQFAYPKYRIFQILLESSLFQLSGSGLLYQLRRRQELNSQQSKESKVQEALQKEASQFYG